MEKKLTRSLADAKIAGVCSGVAKYFNIDPSLVRIIWLVLVIACGIGALAYLICWLIMPKE